MQNKQIFRLAISVGLCLLSFLSFVFTTQAQGRFQERLRQKLNGLKKKNESREVEKIKIAGLNVAVWRPESNGAPAPLVIFSHGFHGMNTQSVFLMDALAEAGYLVMAPNHKDAAAGGQLMMKPEEDFKNFNKWSEDTYKDRRDDLKNLVAALHEDPNWNSKIDWNNLVLAGHSLGGYTALACAGAWPTWKMPGVKAVLALSPYAQPFLLHGDLDKLQVPVMYQGGTLDFGITPFLKGERGAFSKTSSPAYFVDFDRASHLFWTGFNRDTTKQDLIDYYCIAFLSKYVRGDKSANPAEKHDGVCELKYK